jgi:hypothetical protein
VLLFRAAQSKRRQNGRQNEHFELNFTVKHKKATQPVLNRDREVQFNTVAPRNRKIQQWYQTGEGEFEGNPDKVKHLLITQMSAGIFNKAVGTTLIYSNFCSH